MCNIQNREGNSEMGIWVNPGTTAILSAEHLMCIIRILW